MAEESKSGFRHLVSFFRQVFKDFSEDNCPRLAAAISYYTAFALPPLLVFIVLLVALIVSRGEVEGMISEQVGEAMGPEVARQVQTMIRNADRIDFSGSTPAFLLGIAALVFSASGAFLSLQGALNTAWGVRPDPGAGGVKNFILKRLLSLGMIVTVAFLLLVSLIVSGLVSAFGGYLEVLLPGGISAFLVRGANGLFSLGVITVLFAAMFKILPDARISWRDVWVGALFTAILFVIGKTLIGLYIGRSNPGSVFGAAGSLALILLWLYYSALILLLGAEFTQVWVRRHGKIIQPEPGAVRVRTVLDRDRAAGQGPAP